MTEFPALTLWQPWASLIFTHDKRHETRQFRLPERLIDEWIAIHAAQRAPALEIGLDPLCRRRFGPDYRAELPRGVVLGLVRFDRSRRTEAAPGASPEDIICGDWSPGRSAWPILETYQLAVPIEATGRQGWWKVDIEPPADLGEARRPTHGIVMP